MQSEATFKQLTLVLVLIHLAIRIRYAKAEEQVKARSIRNQRRETWIYYLAGASWLPICIYILTPWIDALRLPIPIWLRWTGGIVLAAGDVLFYWSHRTLGRNWSPALEIRVGHSLTRSGPYKWVRHPMYSSFMLIGTGLLFLTANWAAGGCYLGMVCLMYALRVSREEEMMIEEFGDEYRCYMRHTGRLIPKWRF